VSESANLVWVGFSASLAAGLGTGVGALAVFAIRDLSDRLEDGLLSFAAGIMLAASFFSLLLPALDFAAELARNSMLATAIVSLGVLLGAAALYLVHRYVPHEHFVAGREGPDSSQLSRIWLFVIAITLHNFPEGMAVGVGFADGDIDRGTALAAGIWLQNLPEGLAVAVSLMVIGFSRLRAFVVATATGLVEPVGGAFGSAVVSLAQPLVPWALAFAAGAMLFVISDEVIPETHRGGNAHLATFSLLIGVIVMMFLDAVLG